MHQQTLILSDCDNGVSWLVLILQSTKVKAEKEAQLLAMSLLYKGLIIYDFYGLVHVWF